MQPDTVTANKVVSVTYVIRKQDGEIFEYTDLPIDYVHGMNSKLFGKVERALETRCSARRRQEVNGIQNSNFWHAVLHAEVELPHALDDFGR